MKANFPYLQVNSPWEEAPEQPLSLSSVEEEGMDVAIKRQDRARH